MRSRTATTSLGSALAKQIATRRTRWQLASIIRATRLGVCVLCSMGTCSSFPGKRSRRSLPWYGRCLGFFLFGFIIGYTNTWLYFCVLRVGIILVAQVQLQAGGSTPKIVPVKPKVYLTCSLRLPPSHLVKL